MPDVDLRVNLAGVTLKNPVVVASGTFGFGREYNQFYDLGELGASAPRASPSTAGRATPPPASPRPPWAS